MQTKAVILVLSMPALLTACSPSLHLKIDSEIPTPLGNPHPVSIGVYFTSELRNSVYLEDSKDRPGWRIESGAAQVQLFNRILSALFESVREVDTIGAATVAAVLKPEIKQMQFAVPRETHTNLYEVWIEYRLQLFDADSRLIASWPVIGYGKSFARLFAPRSDRLNAAFKQALRDAGAKFALNFDNNKEVRQWLADNRACVRGRC